MAFLQAKFAKYQYHTSIFVASYAIFYSCTAVLRTLRGHWEPNPSGWPWRSLPCRPVPGMHFGSFFRGVFGAKHSKTTKFIQVLLVAVCPSRLEHDHRGCWIHGSEMIWERGRARHGILCRSSSKMNQSEEWKSENVWTELPNPKSSQILRRYVRRDSCT